jgi:RNA-dependent RNA polymerase
MVLDQADAAGQQYQSGVPVQRSPSLGTFILDSLDMAGRELKTRHLRAFDNLKNHFDARVDHDLIQPFTEAETRANKLKEQNCHKFSDELEAVVAHVEEVRLIYNKFWALRDKLSNSTKKGGNRKEVDAGLANIARIFAEGPADFHTFMTPNLAAIKAAYAYQLSTNSAFGFSMAYRDLCTIKAIASQHIPTTRLFAEAMSIGSSFLRVLGENSGES